MRKTTKKPTERIVIYNPNTVRETDIGNDTVGDFLSCVDKIRRNRRWKWEIR